MTEYVTVRIPKNLAEEVDGLKGKHGFTTRAEIVKEALRQILREYNPKHKQKENRNERDT